MKHKSFNAIEVKADDEEKGTFEALVSVFNNVDLGGDRMLPGSFTKTLENWRSSGKPLPVIWSHSWDNPLAHIGTADPTEIKETSRGLVVKGQLDIGQNDYADAVYRLLKRESVTGFSFGYSVPAGGEKRGKDGINEVSEVDLIEVGPTLKGMNPEAQLQAVKSLEQAVSESNKSSAGEPAKEEPPPPEVKDERNQDASASRSRTSDPTADHIEMERLRAFL